MAKLLIKTAGFQDQVLNLKLGVNRFGRSAANDFAIPHPTLSARHCEITVGDGELVVRDCGSTNGTFVDGRPVTTARLAPGQTLRLGDVELLVEKIEVSIAIPEFDRLYDALPPPAVLPDGSLLCPKHAETPATYLCTRCGVVMCDACVHRLRRHGGKLWYLCAICSSPCEPLGPQKKKRKSIFDLLHKTVKLPFLNRRRRPPRGRA